MPNVATVADMRVGVAVAAAFCFAVTAGAQAPARSPRELYESLNAVRVDPDAVYAVRQLELRRADVRISLDEGALAFFAPLDGRVTGVVFSGRGHAISAPRDPVEKQQLARFLGAPVLDEEFRTAFLRFTDATAEELQQQLRKANLQPRADPDYAARWDEPLAQMNRAHSLRILADWIAENPHPYFYAALEGVKTGMFDVVIDERREEPFSIGQTRAVDGAAYYDVWAAYRPAGFTPPAAPFRAVRYTIETSVLPDHSLDETATVALRTESEGERMLVFELSRFLTADAVTTAAGETLPFFQNEGLSDRERSLRGNDRVSVILPRPSRRGDEFTLRVHARGSVITDAGNGVIFVGARGSWYPHLGDADSFADYDLTLRWPRRLRLVATGAKVEEHEEGEFRVGRWRTERPIPVAGFNLGEYASASINDGSYGVEVFANRQLEQALSNRLAAPQVEVDPLGPTPFGVLPSNRLEMPIIVPSPADALRQLAKDIASSVRFYEAYNGPFPYKQLSVSQIPGTFGQGWPGLLYVSTLSFLPAAAQRSMGLSQAGHEHFSELVPFHEVAHQWWGNVVGWRSYRDQWICEAFANYLALLFADSQKNPDRALRDWLDRYRRQLLLKRPGEDAPPAEIGPLSLGNRLSSSKSPNGFEQVIYGKGAWVIHMLRMLLRQPGSRAPDARFNALLHTLATKYAGRALSTADLQREVEAVMTPSMEIEGGRSMEWFFDEWVRGVGIPRYRVEYSVRPTDSGGFLVRGKLLQTGVPRGFVAPVPLFANIGAAHPVSLGTVIASGAETNFHFVTTNAPKKIIIDPQMTLLHISE